MAAATQGALGEWYNTNPLRAYRKSSGAHQASVALQLGVSVQQVGKWERGEHRPSLDTMIGISELLGKTAGDTFEDWMKWLADAPAN